MYNNFETLLEKCKKYYFIKTLKNIFYILIVVTISILIYMFYNFNNKVVKEKVIKDIETHKVIEGVENTKEVSKKNIEHKVTQKDEKTTNDVKYDLSFDDNYEQLNKKVNTLQKKSTQKNITKKNAPKPKVQSNSFSISTKNINSIENLLEAYKKNKTYSLAIKISDFYYKNKNFNKSLSWSKKANKLNSKDEESWILYASSEYALGNKKIAIKVLSIYLKNTASSKAEKLLKSWKKGE